MRLLLDVSFTIIRHNILIIIRHFAYKHQW